MELYFVIMSALLGLILGSFINALAYRLPRNESLMTRSHCTVCMKDITGWENIPLLSWVILRGKCFRCKEPISPRYPLVELTTSLVFYLFAQQAITYGHGYLFVALMLFSFAFVGITLALIDIDTKKLPTQLIYGGFIVAILGAYGYQAMNDDSTRSLSALIGAGIFLVVYFIMWFVKPGAMGFGDVRLAPLTGFILGWLGPQFLLMGFFIPWFMAVIWLIPGMLTKKVKGKTAVPFGPWMILGTILVVIFSDILNDVYLRLGGI